jgi:predicted methyltransferase
MLATNTHNRKPRKRHVDILAKEILSGEWQLTHQGIAFSAPSEDGTATLIDGQHRLLAIAAAERPATLLVSRGWPMATQEAADMGTARSVELPDGVVDVAFICDVYHHFEYPADTMKSLWKAMKPGGTVVLIDFHRIAGKSSEWTMGHVRAGQEVFEREIAAAGFEKVGEEKGFLLENYFVRFRKKEKP